MEFFQTFTVKLTVDLMYFKLIHNKR